LPLIGGPPPESLRLPRLRAVENLMRSLQGIERLRRLGP